jgi:hypothetical protein
MNAFTNCRRLSSICIPSSVVELGESCFTSCQSLSKVTFESGSRLSEIGDQAFAGCWSLSSICIPSSLGNIVLAHPALLGCTRFETTSDGLCRVQPDLSRTSLS